MNKSKFSPQKQKRISIVFQGLWDVGKSAILTRLEEGKFVEGWLHTIGNDVKKLTVEGIEIVAWNLKRRERGRPNYESYYRRSDGTVCVIDSTDAIDSKEFEHALEEMEVFFKEENPRVKVMMVLANKQDLDGALPVEDVEKAVRARVAAHDSTMTGKTVIVRGCSAKTGEGVKEAFSFFLEEVQKHRYEEPKPTPPGASTKDSDKNKESRFHFLKQLYANSFVKSLLYH